jgi:hypothetical protein
MIARKVRRPLKVFGPKIMPLISESDPIWQFVWEFWARVWGAGHMTLSLNIVLAMKVALAFLTPQLTGYCYVYTQP